MERWITSAKLIVLAGFIVVSAGTAWYEWAYVWPVKRCDARGAWWDGRDRQCLTPLPIWRITGRGVAPTAPPVAAPPNTGKSTDRPVVPHSARGADRTVGERGPHGSRIARASRVLPG
jgi:hypothetical protein